MNRRRYKSYLYTGEPMCRATQLRHERKQNGGQRRFLLKRAGSRNKVRNTSMTTAAPNSANNVNFQAGMSPLVPGTNDDTLGVVYPADVTPYSDEPLNDNLLLVGGQAQEAGGSAASDFLDVIADSEEIFHSENLSPTSDKCSSPSRSSSSSTSEEQEEEFVEKHHTEPEKCDQGDKELPHTLCPCTDTTVGDVVFSCLALGLRHSLTWEAQIDILKMVNSFFKDEKIPTTKYSFFKYFQMDNSSVSVNVFCPDCEAFLGKKKHLDENKQCTFCNSTIDISKPSNYFVSISLENQFRKLFEDPQVVNMILTHRFQRSKENKDAIEDIYDGEEYRKHFLNSGLLSDPFNISISFFVDGVSPRRSTGKTLWPVYATINELPFKDRYKHIFLAALYIGPKDPNQFVFLQPFVQEMRKLSSVGFTWNHNGAAVTSKVVPLCAVTDSVARSQVLNMQSFKGYHGCTFCYQKQERVPGRGPRFGISLEKVEERTHESTLRDAQIAHERKDSPRVEERIYKGVKGPSILLSLLYFNVISGCVVDYMHAILLGVAKTYMENVFDSSRKKFWVGMHEDRVGIQHLMQCIDERLLKIKPPACITRVPRSIQDMKLWKASEWRSWLIFYCIPCLQGLLKEKHLAHLSMLSSATCILLQKSITISAVEEAHRLFLGFTFHFEKYFGIESMTYNIHLLSHICKGVQNWGPLWTHNAFPYEGYNRHLLQMYHSPFNVVLQIARKFLVYSSIPSACTSLTTSDRTVEFCENILNWKLKHFIHCKDFLLLGRGQLCSLTEDEEHSLQAKTGFSLSECLSFQRILLRGMKFAVASYGSTKQNNDSYACLKNGMIVVLTSIVKCPTEKVYIIARKIKLNADPVLHNDHVTLKHVYKIKGEGRVKCIKPSDIECQCIAMILLTGNFVCKVPFGCKRD